MDRRTPQTCQYREDAQSTRDGDIAICNLLKMISGLDQHPALHVARDACNACCDSYPPSAQDLNPVVASLLFALSEQVIDANGIDGCDLDKAKALNRWAEKSLPAVGPDEDDCADISRKSYEHLAGLTVDQIAALLPYPEPCHSDSKRRVTSWAVGITTAPRRLPTLQQCVRSVIDSGWTDPVLFIDGDVTVPDCFDSLQTCRRQPAVGAFPNYVLSLCELFMRNPHADAYLMIQDDALFLGAESMREYLQQMLWPVEGPSIVSLYCSKKYNQQNSGWHLFPGNWIWGAVAFVYSPDAVRKFLTSSMVYEHRSQPDDQGLSKIDVLLGRFAVAHQIPVVFPSPSLVQHIGTVSTIWNVARAVNARHADQFLGDLF